MIHEKNSMLRWNETQTANVQFALSSYIMFNKYPLHEYLLKWSHQQTSVGQLDSSVIVCMLLA